MPLAALEHGVPWTWSSFGEYLGALEGRLGVNAGFLVGHCALRRKVIGAEARRGGGYRRGDRRHARPAGRVAPGRRAWVSRPRSHGRTPTATGGRSARATPIAVRCWPSARRWQRTRAPRSSTSPTAGLDNFTDDEVDLMTTMSVTAQRHLNWNVLTVDAKGGDRIEHQLAASSAAEAAGGKIVALTMPTLVPMNMSFRNHCALFLIPGWGDVMGLPIEERMGELADPAVRTELDTAGARQGGRRLPRPVPLGHLHHRRHLRPCQRGLRLPHRKGRHEGRTRQGALRHPARHRAGRRPAHGAVAQHRRRRRLELDHARRHLGGPRHAGRL